MFLCTSRPGVLTAHGGVSLATGDAPRRAPEHSRNIAPASTNVIFLIVPDLFLFFHKFSILPRISVPEIARDGKGRFNPSSTELKTYK